MLLARVLPPLIRIGTDGDGTYCAAGFPGTGYQGAGDTVIISNLLPLSRSGPAIPPAAGPEIYPPVPIALERRQHISDPITVGGPENSAPTPWYKLGECTLNSNLSREFHSTLTFV